MPPTKGPLWEFFLPGAKQNSSQYVAHCLGCIRHHRQVQNPPDNSDLALKARLVWGEATLEHAIASASDGGHVRGEKTAMIAHLIGTGPSQQVKKNLCPLKLLFSGAVVEKPCPKQFTREVLMMELLAAEESDEEPDDGAWSGSGDDFEL
ncbi:hypothetical protein B0H17DRAFT_1049402 [Mycena rosella]|uniref:Uncharacterized protein n=1 Tax=Mycena rosella TaxID=1033263 RepID=A0AAD7GKR6_MYCRO|nr:hypothetical protein B0H17DRAFT_1049402 [Mycena rosella]